MGKQIVRVERMNWDNEYLRDIASGNGFTITEPATFQFDDKKEKSLYGPRSTLYGTGYEDETAFIERCRCECGTFKGLLFKGEICPFCGKEVKKRDINIEYTGWVSLGKDYVINPFYYNKIDDCYGKLGGRKALQDIIVAKRHVGVDGNCRLAKPEEIDENTKNPFLGIGIDEYRKRFFEINAYFKEKKKKKAPDIERLEKEVHSVFTAHIPVYSTFLRPSSVTADTFYFNSIDKEINPIFSLSDKLPNAEPIDKNIILNNIQHRVNTLWNENFNLINGKEGIIRGQLLGGSLNHTSRNVIVPDPTLHDDEVGLSYHTFLHLYAFRIMYYLMKMDDIPLAKAFNIWSRSYKFDNRVYEIMKFMLKKEKPMILMNRNPTLNYYSLLRMRIRNIKMNIEDYTLSVPLSVLPGLNADSTKSPNSGSGMVVTSYMYGCERLTSGVINLIRFIANGRSELSTFKSNKLRKRTVIPEMVRW